MIRLPSIQIRTSSPGLRSICLWMPEGILRVSARANFQAKFGEVRLSSDQLSVEIVPRELDAKDVLGKVYLEKYGLRTRQEDIEFRQDAKGSVSLDFVPDWWSLCILSKATGEILDYRRFHISWPSPPKGVRARASPVSHPLRLSCSSASCPSCPASSFSSCPRSVPQARVLSLS